MIIPIKCFSCSKVLADKWEYYKAECEKVEKEKEKKDITEIDNGPPQSKYFVEPFKKEILDRLGLDRYCCRRHMLGHVDIIDHL